MQHWQEHHRCGVCGREIVVSIISNGSIHQEIVDMVCIECVPDPNHLLKEGEIKDIPSGGVAQPGSAKES